MSALGVESIFKQDLDDSRFEVIIVNDGSTDRSMEMIADIIQAHSNITVINQENLSLSVARNNGIAVAKGEYIIMPDSDDLCTAIAATWELTKSEGITPEARKAIIKSLSATYYNLIYRLLKYNNKVTDRVKILRFLYTLAPDLRLSNNIKQRIGSWVSRKAPRQYLAIQSVRWKKYTGDGFDSLFALVQR